MNWNSFMHGVGIGCLLCIAAIAVGVIIAAVFPNWACIWDTACGRPWQIERAPAFPTESAATPRAGHLKLRAAEAVAQPTREAA